MTRPPIRVVYDKAATRRVVETLRFSIEVFDARDNLLEVLGRLADLVPARAAFAAAIAKYPDKRIWLCQGGRVLAKSEEPPEWLTAYRPIPVFEEKPSAALEALGLRPLPPDRRPQDRTLDGRGLKFTTLEHGGEYPDSMPQAIRLTDPLGRSALYVPLSVDGRVVDTNDDPPA